MDSSRAAAALLALVAMAWGCGPTQQPQDSTASTGNTGGTGGAGGTGGSAGASQGAGGNSAAPIKVFLMAGQSNMVGFGPLADEDTGDWEGAISLAALIDADQEPATLLSPRNDVWVTFSNGNGVHPAGLLEPGFGADQRFFGPELGMGQVLGDAWETPVVMFKSAVGGTTLGADWRPPSSGGETGPLYTAMIQSFSSFLQQDLAGAFSDELATRGYEVAAFVWLQGWNDQFEDGFVAQYADNLTALVRDVREDLDRPELAAIIVEGPTLQQELRDARQQALATLEAELPGSTAFVETEDLVNEPIPGNFHFHYSAAHYLEVGRRTGQAISDQSSAR